MPTKSHSSVDRFVMPTEFLDELAYLLIEYEVFEGIPATLSVRLCKQVAKFGEVFYRPDGTPLYGPVYEAVWIHGVPGCNNILSPRQLANILKYITTNKYLSHIPEEQIIHAQPYHDKA